MNIPRGIIVLALGAAAGLIATSVLGLRARHRATRATARGDSLAAEVLAERARADGWSVTFAAATGSLLEDLAAADSQSARLARELEAARATPVSRTVVTAIASGSARATAVVHAPTPPEHPADTAAAARSPAPPDSITAHVDDGLLDARIRFVPREAVVDVDYSVRPRLELHHVLAPDDRLLVFARATDPRVRVLIDTLQYQLPRPERRGFPYACAGVAGGSGTAVALEPDWWTVLAGAVATWIAC